MGGDWLFDLGNTRLKFARLAGEGAAVDMRALAHDRPGWEDALPAGDTAYVASVVPEGLRTGLLDALTRRFRRIALARTLRRCDGLEIAYAEPHRLGVDRFLAMLGARARACAPGPVLVVAVGTALTLDLVDAGGRHLGGRIAPAPGLMREALHARVPHLPAAGGAGLGFATDTAAALASGCDGAALALVAASVDEATRLLGTPPALLLHGGDSARLQARLPQARQQPALVLEGLARWVAVLRGGDPVAGP